jgi:predicted DNA-binding protein with PD1-like motif
MYALHNRKRVEHALEKETRMPSMLLALLIAFCGLGVAGCHGGPSRRQVTAQTSPEQDAKPNSSAVPDAYALSGQFERTVVFRFKYDTDLLVGLQKMVKQEKIRNAVILSGIGSVRNYHVHVVSNRTFPSQNIFVQDPTGPADLQSVNGYVIDGRVHAHVVLANADHAFGGHLEPGTTVFTFAILTLGVLGDTVNLGRVDDKTYR